MADNIHAQPWLIEIAMEPKSKAEGEKLAAALAKLAADDPTFGVSIDAESGQAILKGTGSIIGDLNSRRGQIRRQDMRGDANVIDAVAPLAHMFGYANALRLMSQERTTFTMQFDHYALVPLPEDDPPFRPAVAMRA
jgi:translation elongation factor EF-G